MPRNEALDVSAEKIHSDRKEATTAIELNHIISAICIPQVSRYPKYHRITAVDKFNRCSAHFITRRSNNHRSHGGTCGNEILNLSEVVQDGRAFK
jgi:hypothetical protein